jgi:hypothetical protein
MSPSVAIGRHSRRAMSGAPGAQRLDDAQLARHAPGVAPAQRVHVHASGLGRRDEGSLGRGAGHLRDAVARVDVEVAVQHGGGEREPRRIGEGIDAFATSDAVTTTGSPSGIAATPSATPARSTWPAGTPRSGARRRSCRIASSPV